MRPARAPRGSSTPLATLSATHAACPRCAHGDGETYVKALIDAFCTHCSHVDRAVFRALFFQCLPEAQFLLTTCNAPAPATTTTCQFGMTTGTPTHKVSLVLDGGNINDGTFNQLAFEGARDACTASASCLLEVDRIDDSTLLKSSV